MSAPSTSALTTIAVKHPSSLSTMLVQSPPRRPAPPPPRGPAPSRSPSLQDLEREERRVREQLRCAQEFTFAKLYANFGYKFQGLFHALMVQLSSADNKVVVHGVQSEELPWRTKAVPHKSKTAPTKNNAYSRVFTKLESSLEVALHKLQSIVSLLRSPLPSTPFRATKNSSSTQDQKESRCSSSEEANADGSQKEPWKRRKEHRVTNSTSFEKGVGSWVSEQSQEVISEGMQRRGRRAGKAVQRRRAAQYFSELVDVLVSKVENKEAFKWCRTSCPPRSEWGQRLASKEDKYNPFL